MTMRFSRFSYRITDGRRPGKEKDLEGLYGPLRQPLVCSHPRDIDAITGMERRAGW